MKKRFIFVIMAVCIGICIFLVMHDGMELENNNEVFTEEFFMGVESAYMKSEIVGNSDEIKGWRLRRLCQKLSAVELEKSEDSENTVTLSDGALIYGEPYRLVFTYQNGECKELDFRDSLFNFADAPVLGYVDALEGKMPFRLTYSAMDLDLADLILPFFE